MVAYSCVSWLMAGIERQSAAPIPNPTLFPIELGARAGDDLVEAAFAAFSAMHEQLAALQKQVAPPEFRADWRLAELYVRRAITGAFASADLYPRRLKFLASAGTPLGVCMGPIFVRAGNSLALAPAAGIGCGLVFEQKGNRAAGFPDWCPDCHAKRRADRAASSLVRWKNVHDAYSRDGAEAYARELWRLIRLHKRRSPFLAAKPTAIGEETRFALAPGVSVGPAASGVLAGLTPGVWVSAREESELERLASLAERRLLIVERGD